MNINKSSGQNEKPIALIIENNELVRTSETLLLQHAGFKVLTAANGGKGIEAFRKHEDAVDLVVTDYMMPEKNGEEVQRSVNDEQPTTPVMLVSTDAAFLGETTLEGFAAVLSKPFNGNQLVEKAIELIEH